MKTAITARVGKMLLSVLLTLCLLVSAALTFGVQSTAETEEETASSIEGGTILHCFNWSYDSIRENLPAIAAAGYTAVQTSPVQRPKDYSVDYTDSNTEWWKLYQPLGLSIAPDGTSWLGGADELEALCDAAEGYGIKVIVDIVANHLANGGTSGGGYSNLSPDVENSLKNALYYHTSTAGVSDGSRYAMTQNHLGMPDLNTGNLYIQQRVLALLEECIDLGVDGFRFDAAKHIELPTDPGCASNFWPFVVNGAKDHAEENGKDVPYFYGEILYTAGTDIHNYTQYIDITDSVCSGEVRGGASSGNAGRLADGRYQMGEEADDAVLWVESHDTYMDGSSSGIPDDQIVKAWAIVGARADSTALFLARPGSVMGEAGDNLTWKSKAVSEVNKFKTHFDGTTEYLSFTDDLTVAYIERGCNGVVISKLNGAGAVSLEAHRMVDGVYTDAVGGGTFTVSGGTISGTVGDSGVAVVYNAAEQAKDPEVGFYLFGYIDGANYACEEDASNTGEYLFENGKVTAHFSEDSYVAVKKGDNSAWYMTNGWQGTETTSVTLYNTTTLGSDANKLFVPGGVKVVFTLTPGEDDTYTLSYEEAAPDYFLFGSINGADYGCEGDWQNMGEYKFVDGTLTTRFSTDSYVAVKLEDNAAWYMTNGWQGTETTSVTLYNTNDLGNSANKLFVPGGVKVTFTLTPGEDDTLTLSYERAPVDYYLFGSINGVDYGCEGDWQTLGAYKFTNGTLTARFTADSYVAVKDEYCENWYMTNGWQGTETTSVTLYNTTTLGTDANKLFVPGGVTVVFTLTPGEGDVFTLSYTVQPDELNGDVNADGILNIEDVTEILNCLSGGDEMPAAADVDGSGSVTIEDVTALLNVLANN